VRPGDNLRELHNRNAQVRAYAMYVGLNVWPIVKGPIALVHQRQIIIDYHVDLEDINAPRHNICRDEDLKSTIRMQSSVRF
jgi:hypothetical protein